MEKKNVFKAKDSWKQPTISRPTFRVLTEEEAASIRGGKWRAGTCVIGGYACSDSGGLHWGVCAILGYTT